MGLSSTLYTAISGLQSNSQAMTVTGNNIANTNTIGFKSSSTVFADMLSANIASSSGNSEVGQGSQVQSVLTDFSQGGFESTGSSTDLAIQGDGFLIVSDPANDIQLYTRNGSLSFDANGYLVTADGYRVQGSPFNDDGEMINGNLSDIQVDHVAQIAAKKTENVTLQTNLDSNSEILGAFDVVNPDDTSNYVTTATVYDSLGTAHLTTCYFTKTADQTWTWNLAVDSDDLAAGGAEDLTVVSSGVITFDENGNLLTGEVGTTGALAWANGSNAAQDITYNFETTQFDSDSTVFSQDQDGYASGEVTSVDIAADGTVSAVYSNGETIAVAMISLATFTNPNGLDSAGGSLYSATSQSGTPTIGYPGTSQGMLVTQALELSNVDLSAEFVDLITVQNAYTANSRVITTTDEMLQELLNLKR
ncbi:MAG: flagellar hook protein FlgE [Proteobacteria bacterium]|nr:flagellar hook protein FlgE [Pseudomonadota bacterium]MBU1233580.1 flagellar hook protein FlgE [Pseudomonadota bacterium]MBU1420581.1 flagellar hook protein FlgE [Pseudomonadota bacterium]MBU1454986.1 flagellar hook protein FlgE [Pseudomonadota bacterium]